MELFEKFHPLSPTCFITFTYFPFQLVGQLYMKMCGGTVSVQKCAIHINVPCGIVKMIAKVVPLALQSTIGITRMNVFCELALGQFKRHILVLMDIMVII